MASDPSQNQITKQLILQEIIGHPEYSRQPIIFSLAITF